MFAASVIAVSVSLGASLLQSLAHLGSGIPGCGLESACAEAASGAWGALPLIDWPMSFIGSAFFAGVLVGWAVCLGAASSGFRHLVRAGAMGSVVLMGVILYEGYLCWYSLAVHFGNLAFWIIVERSPRPSTRPNRPAAFAVGMFAVLSMILFFTRWRAESVTDARADRDRNESSQEIVNRSRNNARSGGDRPPITQVPSALGAPGRGAATDPVDSDAVPGGFTGRYRMGPESCAIRVVAFTDFQCLLCAEIEKSLRDIVGRHADVSLSVKHFPACGDCNAAFRDKNIHPNACRAARAAEAAGLLQGDDGFWAMSDWIFERAGRFDDKDLIEALAERGYERDAFVRVMDGEATLKRVQSDIEEGIILGLRSTPMLFINGVELRGVRRADSVVRAIESLRKKQLPALTAEADHPSGAPEKYLAEWRDAPVQGLPAGERSRALGEASAVVRIVMWGDYQGPFTPSIDIAIRSLLEGRTDARYSFRYFPVNKSCNPVVATFEHLGACLAARCAESAALVGGNDGFWKMHNWLMRNPDRVFDIAIRRAAEEIGLDADELFRTMNLNSVNAAIEEDARAAVETGLKRTPWLFINGKRVPRFLGDADQILGLIIEEAARSGDSSRAESDDE
ncbi:MAG: DsbA family protein [Planctomycetota bacterium]|nr:DsbA family protein [Planctomycetota bacterium]